MILKFVQELNLQTAESKVSKRIVSTANIIYVWDYNQQFPQFLIFFTSFFHIIPCRFMLVVSLVRGFLFPSYVRSNNVHEKQEQVREREGEMCILIRGDEKYCTNSNVLKIFKNIIVFSHSHIFFFFLSIPFLRLWSVVLVAIETFFFFRLDEGRLKSCQPQSKIKFKI